MSHLAMLLLALLAALAQVAVLPALHPDPLAVPLLPVALLAGWCAVRSPAESWPVVLLAPLVVGPLSEERSGWFLLALLPAAALATLLSSVDRRGPPPRLAYRLGVAALVAVVGTFAYAAVLAVAGGVPGRLLSDSGALAGALAWTALLAVTVALALAPMRPRARGLFA